MRLDVTKNTAFWMFALAGVVAACGEGAQTGQADASADTKPEPDAHTTTSKDAGSPDREASIGRDAPGPMSDGAVTLVNPAPGSKLFIGTNFWNIEWEPSTDYFLPGVDFATTTDPWQPQFLADLAPYHVLRFMDWNDTNASDNPQATWSTRTQKTASQLQIPIAFEWQIDLCNREKKDYWLNVPHMADATYWTQLAELVYAELDPSLRVYLEWSNEVWNGGFPQEAYATSQAESLGLPGSIPSASYYVYAAVRVYAAFEAVFGKGSPRLVKVLAGQAAWTGPCEAHMTALADSTINPTAEMPDVYAVAPYLTGTSISDLQGAIATTAGWITSTEGCVASAKLPVITYEGGSDSSAASGNGCATLQVDPGMQDLYVSYLSALSDAGLGGPFTQYTHVGSCWGLKPATSDTTDASPKYQGVLDWLAAHP
jgi:hypothetical protein